MNPYSKTGPWYPMKNLQRPTLVALALCIVQGTMAQSPKTEGWLSSPGVVGTMVLLGIVLFIAVLIIAAKVSRLIQQTKEKRDAAEGNPGATDEQQARRDAALHYRLRGDELGGTTTAFDDKALIVGATSEPNNPIVDEKIYSRARLDVPKPLQQLVIWYLAASTFWLVFGTLVGEYLGLKFVLAGPGRGGLAVFRQAAARAYQHRLLGLGIHGHDRFGVLRYRPHLGHQGP
jgi:cytochrome c oxidase cbb3-type subunit 1